MDMKLPQCTGVCVSYSPVTFKSNSRHICELNAKQKQNASGMLITQYFCSTSSMKNVNLFGFEFRFTSAPIRYPLPNLQFEGHPLDIFLISIIVLLIHPSLLDNEQDQKLILVTIRDFRLQSKFLIHSIDVLLHPDFRLQSKFLIHSIDVLLYLFIEAQDKIHQKTKNE
ncbi:MAG: hypothetical protein EZS28_028945 [Streblomastix strix]|uniref:Uncharacterized protein n=1 Tax=Streblomastix strix TaxID=222440 RepID=A0A5J4UYQ5_9EUKA|nr:MAG: hypothetical protein EZS28_028945 [Streblomastix strix]